MSRRLWLGLAAGLSIGAIPLALTAAGVVPQVPMVQEVLGANFVMLPVMTIEVFPRLPVGHAYLLAVTYLPSAVVHFVLAGLGGFDQQLLFAILVYLLQAAALAAILAVAFVSDIGFTGRLGLVWLALSTTVLERATFFGLMINYHKGTELLLLLLALVTMLWLRGDPPRVLRRPAVLGLLLAAFVANKVSYGLIAGPLLMAIALDCGEGPALRRLWRFAVGAASGFAAILVAFSLFSPVRLAAVIGQLWDTYAKGWLRQSSPFVAGEAYGIFDPHSYYLGWHVALVLWAVALLGVAVVALRRPDWKTVILLLTQLAAAAVLAWQLQVRRAQGTMFDVTTVTVFSTVVLAFALARRLPRPLLGNALVAALGLAFVAGLATSQPAATVARLLANSRVAVDFERWRAGQGSLPTVYYMHGLDAPLMFPGADFQPFVASGSPALPVYMARYHPGVRLSAPANGPVAGPHIAVVPEYLDTLPDTPANHAEWPEMWPRVDVFNNHPALRDAITPDRPDCRVFQFSEIQDRAHLIYVIRYATRVTACPVK